MVETRNCARAVKNCQNKRNSVGRLKFPRQRKSMSLNAFSVRHLRPEVELMQLTKASERRGSQGAQPHIVETTGTNISLHSILFSPDYLHFVHRMSVHCRVDLYCN